MVANRTMNNSDRLTWLMPVLIIFLTAMIAVSIIVGIFLGCRFRCKDRH